MTQDEIMAVLEGVRAWPRQDQEELAQLAREIEARRAGVYKTTADERFAIEAAQSTAIVVEDEVADFWKQRGIA